MFEKATFTAILRALTPIAHHSRSFGNTAIVMDEPVVQPDGRMIKVPIITGDTMRHGLREAGAYAFLDAAGLLDEPCLSEAALRLLFSGGGIGGAAGATVSIADYRKLIDLVPSLSLLGGCSSNRPHQGRMQVDSAMLICKEALPVLEGDTWISEWIERSGFEPPLARLSINLAQRTRSDPTLNPTMRGLLSGEALALTDDRLLANESAHAENDAIAIEDSKSTMMPRTYETVARGSLFAWSLTATVLTELDRDTLYLMLAAWLSNMVVGGRKGTGNGRMVGVAMSRKLLGRPSAPETITLPDHGKIGDRFRDHVAAHKAEIKDFLATVEA